MRAHAFDTAFEIAARQVEAGTVPFFILGIAGADGVVRLESFEPEGRPRLGTGAVCLLASITKPITATAVMRLAQDGRFPLAAPLHRWLPELEAAGLAPFTAWHVLSQTTGLVDVPLAPLLLAGADRQTLLRRTIESGQRWSPGSHYHYATHPFDLLAEALARALGTPFERLLDETVLAPLGMVDTTFDPARSGARRARVELDLRDDSLGTIPPGTAPEALVASYSSLHLAGGGLWSPAVDLLRFGRAMLRGGELDGTRILGRPLVELMTHEVTVDGLGDTGDRLTHEHYALGWGKPGPTSASSPGAFSHGGVSGTRLLVDPAHDLVLVALTGKWGGATEAIDQVQLAAYAGLD